MAQEPIRPIEHGVLSSVAETTVHTAGGGLKGVVKGGLEGMLTGALVLGGIAAAVAGLAFSAPAAVVWASAISFGIFGGALGGVTGAPIGGVFGTFGGFRSGREKIANERAAAEVVHAQSRIAEAQIHTADAMQAQAVQQMMTARAPMMEMGPDTRVSSPVYNDKGVHHKGHAADAVPHMDASHAQHVLEQRSGNATAAPEAGR